MYTIKHVEDAHYRIDGHRLMAFGFRKVDRALMFCSNVDPKNGVWHVAGSATKRLWFGCKRGDDFGVGY